MSVLSWRKNRPSAVGENRAETRFKANHEKAAELMGRLAGTGLVDMASSLRGLSHIDGKGFGTYVMFEDAKRQHVRHGNWASDDVERISLVINYGPGGRGYKPDNQVVVTLDATGAGTIRGMQSLDGAEPVVRETPIQPGQDLVAVTRQLLVNLQVNGAQGPDLEGALPPTTGAIQVGGTDLVMSTSQGLLARPFEGADHSRDGFRAVNDAAAKALIAKAQEVGLANLASSIERVQDKDGSRLDTQFAFVDGQGRGVLDDPRNRMNQHWDSRDVRGISLIIGDGPLGYSKRQVNVVMDWEGNVTMRAGEAYTSTGGWDPIPVPSGRIEDAMPILMRHLQAEPNLGPLIADGLPEPKYPGIVFGTPHRVEPVDLEPETPGMRLTA